MAASTAASAAWERITRHPSIAGKGEPVDLGPPMLELHAAGASAFAGQLALRLREQHLARELNPRLWSTPEGAPSVTGPPTKSRRSTVRAKVQGRDMLRRDGSSFNRGRQ